MFINVGTEENPWYVVDGQVALRSYKSTLENEKDFTWDGYWQYTQEIWNHYGSQAPTPQN